MAAPHVSGIAADVLRGNTAIDLADIKRGRQLYGMGRVNLTGALDYAARHFPAPGKTDNDDDGFYKSSMQF